MQFGVRKCCGENGAEGSAAAAKVQDDRAAPVAGGLECSRSQELSPPARNEDARAHQDPPAQELCPANHVFERFAGQSTLEQGFCGLRRARFTEQVFCLLAREDESGAFQSRGKPPQELHPLGVHVACSFRLQDGSAALTARRNRRYSKMRWKQTHLRSYCFPMPSLRVAEAARFLGVSDDTVRRWIENGTLPGHRDASGRQVIDSLELAQLARRQAQLPDDPTEIASSARNRFVGLVTEIVMDKVMAQVELQCGPFRVVSLMSSEAVRELGLEPGSTATAVVKATNVIVEMPPGRKQQ